MLDGLIIIIIALFKREAFSPQLLYYKATSFREFTNDERFKTAAEASQNGKLLSVLKRNFSRPWILTMEPIVLLLTCYLTTVYIILFTFLHGYDYMTRVKAGSEAKYETIDIHLFLDTFTALRRVWSIPLFWVCLLAFC